MVAALDFVAAQEIVAEKYPHNLVVDLFPEEVVVVGLASTVTEIPPVNLSRARLSASNGSYFDKFDHARTNRNQV